MTSNAGAKQISKETILGFHAQEGIMDYHEIKTSVMSELKRFFNPEFLNRVDEIVVFHSLTKDHLWKILDIQLKEVDDRMAEKNMKLEVRKKAKEHLIDAGYDEKYGARPLRRTIQKEIEDPLSVEILKGKYSAGATIIVDLDKEGKTVFRQKNAANKAEAEKVTAADSSSPPDGAPPSQVETVKN
jgi:ATP-dependent Clp protease ATP-binding subunit ClpC